MGGRGSTPLLLESTTMSTESYLARIVSFGVSSALLIAKQRKYNNCSPFSHSLVLRPEFLRSFEEQRTRISTILPQPQNRQGRPETWYMSSFYGSLVSVVAVTDHLVDSHSTKFAWTVQFSTEYLANKKYGMRSNT